MPKWQLWERETKPAVNLQRFIKRQNSMEKHIILLGRKDFSQAQIPTR